MKHASCTCNHSTFAGFHDADCPKFTEQCKHEWKFRVDGHDEYFRCSNLPCEETLEVEQAEVLLASARAIMQKFVAFMDEYYSIRGVIEFVKSDSEEDRLLKETYAEMKQWMEDE